MPATAARRGRTGEERPAARSARGVGPRGAPARRTRPRDAPRSSRRTCGSPRSPPRCGQAQTTRRGERPSPDTARRYRPPFPPPPRPPLQRRFQVRPARHAFPAPPPVPRLERRVPVRPCTRSRIGRGRGGSVAVVPYHHRQREWRVRDGIGVARRELAPAHAGGVARWSPSTATRRHKHTSVPTRARGAERVLTPAVRDRCPLGLPLPACVSSWPHGPGPSASAPRRVRRRGSVGRSAAFSGHLAPGAARAPARHESPPRRTSAPRPRPRRAPPPSPVPPSRATAPSTETHVCIVAVL